MPSKDRYEPVPHKPMRTKEQTGAAIGLSRGRIYQLEKQAIAKLRDGLLKDPEIAKILRRLGYQIDA